jgi:hypothetical protein
MNNIDIIGQKFNRLLVLEKTTIKNNHGIYKYKCLCDCGNISYVRRYELIKGTTKSCGCWNKDRIRKHSKHTSRTYNTYQHMLQRCYNSKCDAYQNYGSRGIKVCEQWLGKGGFLKFYEDMGDAPEGLSLDRKDKNGNYEPSNCRWATPLEQSNNQRRNLNITFNGETLTLTQWARKTNISPSTIKNRLTSGWSIEKVLTTSVINANTSFKKKSLLYKKVLSVLISISSEQNEPLLLKYAELISERIFHEIRNSRIVEYNGVKIIQEKNNS